MDIQAEQMCASGAQECGRFVHLGLGPAYLASPAYLAGSDPLELIEGARRYSYLAAYVRLATCTQPQAVEQAWRARTRERVCTRRQWSA